VPAVARIAVSVALGIVLVAIPVGARIHGRPARSMAWMRRRPARIVQATIERAVSTQPG